MDDEVKIKACVCITLYLKVNFQLPATMATSLS